MRLLAEIGAAGILAYWIYFIALFVFFGAWSAPSAPMFAQVLFVVGYLLHALGLRWFRRTAFDVWILMGGVAVLLVFALDRIVLLPWIHLGLWLASWRACVMMLRNR